MTTRFATFAQFFPFSVAACQTDTLLALTSDALLEEDDFFVGGIFRPIV